MGKECIVVTVGRSACFCTREAGRCEGMVHIAVGGRDVSADMPAGSSVQRKCHKRPGIPTVLSQKPKQDHQE